MSNEELALLIQSGKRNHVLDLWSQVQPFVAQMAAKRYASSNGYGGVEVDDLIQSGYFALMGAIKDFRPDGQYKFITYLNRHLQKEFSEAGGYRGPKKYNDPLHSAISLSSPMDCNEPDGDTLLDVQVSDEDQLENVEHQVWIEQLHCALFDAMNMLPSDQQETLILRYWQDLTLREIAKAKNTYAEGVRQQELKALKQLRTESGLEQFIEDRTPYYRHVGVSAFNTTWTSAVEMAAIKREKIRKAIAQSGNHPL